MRVAIALGLLLYLPSISSAAVALRYRVTGSWSSGFQAEIGVDNSGPSSVTGWRLSFDLPASIVDVWGATVAVHTGDRYELTSVAWSSMIPAGGSITIGFVAQRPGGAATPSGCVFDQTSCTFAISAAPSPTPVPSGGATSAPTRTATPSGGSVYLGFGPSIAPVYNYGRALQQSWAFYEAQRSGPLPRFDGDLPFFDPKTGARLHDGFLANRLPWRGDSDVADGADAGLDLTGGWHDAGDHVKFGLPMAFSASFLAWGVLEFEDTLRATGELDHARDNLRWVADYFVRAHPEPNVLWGQVGQGSIDHSIWGPPEVMPHVRPAWKIDLAHPGPDLAAQTSSALAILSLIFRDEPAYSAVLLRHAVELYDFAQATRAPETPTDKSLGRYSDSILDARSYYASTSGAQDDLPWAAAWLYRATGDARYLHAAEADYTRVADNTGHTAWTAVWDDVRYGLYFLMAEIASEPGYAAATAITPAQRQNGYFDYELHARNFLQHWLRSGGVARTPGGMAWLSGWASARYNTMTAFLALVYRQHLGRVGGDAVARQSYLNFATEQVNYVLGDNPLGMSYVVGFGDVYSQVAHHRASHGSTTNNVADPVLPRHVLWGGLAGGPHLDDTYTDDRNEFSLTEVATDMNAGLNGALAGLVAAHGLAGNQPDPSFPPPSPPADELFAEARLVQQQPATLGTQVEVSVVNETAYPPRATAGLVFRYFVDLAELQGTGLTAADVVVDTYRNEGAGASPLRRWGSSGTIWYSEGSFAGTHIVPIGNQYKRKTIELLVRLPWGSTAWNAANDFSFAGLGSTVMRTSRIAVYDTTRPPGAQLVWGQEPSGGGPQPTSTRTTSPAATETRTPLASTPTPTTTVTSVASSTRTATRTTAAGTPTRTATITRTPTRALTPTQSRTATRTPSGARTATRTPTSSTVSGLAASVVIESQWQGGYCAGIAITSTSTQAIRAETLRFVLPAAVVITQQWNGTISRNGSQVTVQLPAWVGTIAPGETQKHFGFCADGSVLPSQPAAP